MIKCTEDFHFVIFIKPANKPKGYLVYNFRSRKKTTKKQTEIKQWNLSFRLDQRQWYKYHQYNKNTGHSVIMWKAFWPLFKKY